MTSQDYKRILSSVLKRLSATIERYLSHEGMDT